MACEVLLFGQELGRFARRLDIPDVTLVEGRSSSRATFAGSIATVVFDAQTLPLDSSAFQHLRRRVGVPLLAIVGSYDEAERSLRSGCSDVLVKPVTAEELRLRLQRVLRLPGPQSIAIGELAIDPASHRVTRGSVEVRLRPLEFKLLYYLAAHAGRVVPYDELLNEVWGYDYDDGSHQAIRAAVRRLRRQVEPEPARPRYILNVARVGYVLRVAEG